MIDTLRAELATYPGAKIQAQEFENGPLVDAPIEMRLIGADLDTLRTLAARVEGMLAKHAGHALYVTIRSRVFRTDLRVAVDRQKAGLLGVPTRGDRTHRAPRARGHRSRQDPREQGRRSVTVRLPTPAGRRTCERITTSARRARRRLRIERDRSADSAPRAGVGSVRGIAAGHPALQRRALGHGDRRSCRRATTPTSSRTRSWTASPRWGCRPDTTSTRAGEIESRRESFGGFGSAVIVDDLRHARRCRSSSSARSRARSSWPR